MACTFTSLPSLEPFVVHGDNLDLNVGEIVTTMSHNENDFPTISSIESVLGVSQNTTIISTPKVTINIAGKPIECLIDTGASVNVIDEVTFKNISNENLTPTKTRIFAYGTPSPLQVLGQIKYPISFQDTEITALFYVIRAQPSSKGGNLINSDTAQKLQLIKFLCALSSPSKSIADQLCAGKPSIVSGDR